jgi:predicted small secreted protein
VNECDEIEVMNKKSISILVLAAGLIAMFSSGCRTMEGAGEDIERAGEKIQQNAD